MITAYTDSAHKLKCILSEYPSQFVRYSHLVAEDPILSAIYTNVSIESMKPVMPDSCTQCILSKSLEGPPSQFVNGIDISYWYLILILNSAHCETTVSKTTTGMCFNKEDWKLYNLLNSIPQLYCFVYESTHTKYLKIVNQSGHLYCGTSLYFVATVGQVKIMYISDNEYRC